MGCSASSTHSPAGIKIIYKSKQHSKARGGKNKIATPLVYKCGDNARTAL
jgi:hypothetical protein